MMVDDRRTFFKGSRLSGDPRGYSPLVAERGVMPFPRRGSREPRYRPSNRRKEEREAVLPPSEASEED